MRIFLNNVGSLLKGIKRIYSPLLEYSRQHLLELLILAITVVGIWISWQSLGLQQQGEFPFFHYNYHDGVFQVDGGSRVEVTKVEWLLPSKSFVQGDQWEFRRVGGHPTILGFFEIRNYLASEMSDGHTSYTATQNAVLCNLYLLGDVGIPALVSVTYDKNNSQGLTNSDFVLITRLDTSIPEVIVQPEGRHVEHEEIEALFNEFKPWYTSTIDTMKDSQNRSCGVIMNQPIEGYSDPDTSRSFEESR